MRLEIIKPQVIKPKANQHQKYLIILLAVLVAALLTLFIFSVYNDSKGREQENKELKTQKDIKKYSIEEVIEPENIEIPAENEDNPAIEGSNKEIRDEDNLNRITITINNLKFYPKDVTISPGTTVIWLNNDTSPHKVVDYERSFYGPRLNPGERYSFTFTKEGTYRYFDAIFPKIGRGKIVVKEEPLPITGGIIGVDLDEEEAAGKFALLVLLFVVMVLGLANGIHRYYKTEEAAPQFSKSDGHCNLKSKN